MYIERRAHSNPSAIQISPSIALKSASILCKPPAIDLNRRIPAQRFARTPIHFIGNRIKLRLAAARQVRALGY